MGILALHATQTTRSRQVSETISRSAKPETPFPSLWRWGLAFLFLGMAWRTVRYLLAFPIWGDEAFVSLNLLDRDYLGLLRPLEYKQVAPMLFLWAESAAYHLLGGAELALRLLPFLAGLGSL